MKKKIIFTLLLAIGFSPLLVKADIIPNNSHPLTRCAKIVNLDMFPEISLIGVLTGPMSDSNPNKILKNNECLSKGYKFNVLNVYWNTKDNVDVVDGNILINNMDVYGGYVNENDPLIKETVEYSLVKSTSGKYSLQKTKVISEYNNGTSSKTENFNTDNISPDINNSALKITKKLKIGLKYDNEVKYLQEVLNRTMMSSLVLDGSFGPKTKIEVIKFQKANNLTADGVVGVKTMAVLNGK